MRWAKRLDSVTAIVAKRAREFVLNSVGCSTETVTGALLDRVVGVMDYPQHSQSCGAVSLYLGMVWVLAAAPVHEPVGVVPLHLGMVWGSAAQPAPEQESAVPL